MKKLLPAFCLFTAGFTLCGWAATVTSTADHGAGTLRQAILDASAGATINFGVTGSIILTNGELLIAKNLNIVGPGPATLAIQRTTDPAALDFRIFNVTTGTVLIAGLTISNGRADAGGGVRNEDVLTLSNCVVIGNAAVQEINAFPAGGGVFNFGTLTILRTLIVSNTAGGGTVVGSGAGIFNNGFLLITDSAVLANQASGDLGGFGGGIYNILTIHLSNTPVRSNTARGANGMIGQPGGGGGIYNAGDISLENCTLADNTAVGGNASSGSGGTAMGGGAFNASGTFRLNRSTVSGNSATGGTSAGGNGGSGIGGGLANQQGTVSVTNSTISGNACVAGPGNASGQAQGGGIAFDGATLYLFNSTIVSNRTQPTSAQDGGGVFISIGSTLEIMNSILAANLATVDLASDLASVDSSGHNLFGITDGFIGFDLSDQAGVTAAQLKLGPLQSNGGPTFTHALLCGSIAINAGNNTGAPPTDQRGFPRVVGGVIDIGAFESSLNTTLLLVCPPDLRLQCPGDVPPPDTNAVSASSTADGVVVTFRGDVSVTNGCVITITRTFDARDTCDNTTNCSQTITVHDTTPPTLTCAPNLTVEVGSSWAFTPPSVVDNCDGTNVPLTLLSTVTNIQCGKALTAARAWLAMDHCGNTSTCTQTVAVVDTRPPSLTCAADRTVQCGTPWLFDPPEAFDFNDGTHVQVVVLNTITNASCGNTFSAIRTWKATDSCTNSSTCSQEISIVDVIPPSVTCPPNQTFECGTPWGFTLPTASDSCSTNVNITVLNTVTNTAGNGSFIIARAWRVADDCGNSVTCTQTISLVDTTLPTLSCPPNQTLECSTPWTFVPPTVTDTCNGDTLRPVIVSTSTNRTCGNTYSATRTWSATDQAGNSNTCVQTVTVVDTSPPVITCAPNQTVECDTPWSFGTPTVTDACDDGTLKAVMVSTTTNRTCGRTYSATRTWSATDACGNTNACSQTITVADTTPPVIVCAPNQTIECGAPWTFGTPTVSDTCDDGTLMPVILSTTTNRPAGISFSATRTWQATDVCGNSNTCSQTITVMDTARPTIFCQPSRTVECGAAWAFDTPTVTDTCDDGALTPVIVSTTTNTTGGHTFTAKRTWSATDHAGNSNTCSQTITVMDTTLPTITCPPNQSVECGTPWSFGTPVVTDTCDTSVLTPVIVSTVTNRSCGGTLTATRLWQATDHAGNTNVCGQTISVVDNTPPVFTCCVADLTVHCLSEVPPSLVFPAVDDCDTNIQITVTTTTNGTCPTIISRAWTASDACGNIATLQQIITVQPTLTLAGLTNQVVCPGVNVAFCSLALGCDVRYQWWRNHTPIPGATNQNLTLTNVAPTDTGVYQVVASGPCQSLTNTATLTVRSPTTATPLTDQFVCPGDAVTFCTTPSGTGPYAFMWFKDGQLIPSANTNCLTLTNVTADDAGLYCVIVSGACGSVLQSANLDVATSTIALGPDNKTICAGGHVTLCALPFGTGPFSFQWFKGPSAITGATNACLKLSNVTTNDSGLYCVRVSGLCNSVTNCALVQVFTPVTIAGLADQTTCPGATVNWCAAIGGSGPLQFTWYLDGMPLAGQTNHCLTLTNVSALDEGEYCLVVSGACGPVYDCAELSVLDATRVIGPSNQVVCAGENVNLCTIPLGSGPFGFQWFKGTHLIANATNSCLKLTNVSATDAATYCVRVSGQCGTLTNCAAVTVLIPTTVSALTNQTICEGGTASFCANVTGSALKYQWFMNNQMLAGETNRCFAITHVTPDAAGDYLLIVNGACGSAYQSATLTVLTNPLAIGLVDQTVCAGSDANLCILPIGSGPFGFLWFKAGNPIPNATNNCLPLTHVGLNDAGTYCVSVSGSCGTFSDCARLFVTTNLIAIGPTDLVACANDSVTFCTTAIKSGPLNYQWFFNGTALTSETNSCLQLSRVTPANVGSYCVVITSDCGAVTNCASLTIDTPCLAVQHACALVPGSSPALMLSGSISNCGSVTLANLTLVENHLGPVQIIASLAPGQSAAYSFAQPNPGCGTYRSVLTVSGDTSCSAGRITNSATSSCAVSCNTCLAATEFISCLLPNDNCSPFDKVAFGARGESQNPAFCYSITISNCGPAALTNLSVVDDKLGNLTTNFPPVLNAGQAVTRFLKMAWSTDTTNVLVATGRNAATGQAVSSSDTVVAQIRQAAIVCRKFVTSPDDLDNVPGDSTVILPKDGQAHAVTYSVSVTNVGEVPLANITISDPSLTNWGCPALPAPFALPPQGWTNFVLCTVPFSCPSGGHDSANKLLGEAGDFAVLELGDGHVSLTGPAGGVQGHVGVGSKGKIEISGSQSVDGNVELASGATFKNSGSGSVGPVMNGVDLSAAITDAQNAADELAGLPCAQSFGTLDSTRTIVGGGGLNVICVQNINLKGASTIYLRGSTSDVFVVNVKGKFTLTGGSRIIAADGVQAQNVVFNLIGKGSDATLNGGGGGQNCCNARLDGSVLAPKRKIALSPGLVNGTVISGDDISIVSGASVRCAAAPDPQPVVNIVTVKASVDSAQSGFCATDFSGDAITVDSECSARIACKSTAPPVFPPACPCDLGYPFASANPRTSILFSESEVLRGFSPSIAQPGDTIKVWYNDEHALLLGVRSVIVKTTTGSTTSNAPVTPLASNPGSTINPLVGLTNLNGDFAGTDPQGRPIYPALFVTDITADPNSRAGDWQYGGAPLPPHAVFGTWKSSVRTVDNTRSPALVTVAVDPDPAKNNWNLGVGDPAPSGLTDQGYGAEVRWNVDDLGLVPGHKYRLQFMVHDGDQNKSGGDVGQACAILVFGGTNSPCATNPPSAQECSSGIVAFLVQYTGTNLSGPAVMTFTGSASPAITVTFNLPNGLANGTVLALPGEGDPGRPWTIDATKQGGTRLGTRTSVYWNGGLTEILHTSCSCRTNNFVPGFPACLDATSPDNPTGVKGEPSPNWRVLDFK